MLFLAQRGDDLLRSRDGISIKDTFEVCRRNERSWTYSQTKQPNTHAADVSNDVGLNLSLQRCPPDVVVCRNEIEARKLQRCSQRIDTIVEFVIAQCANVVSDGRHRFVLNLAFIEIEVRSPLKNIASVDQ